MTQIKIEKIVDASPERIWSIINDFGGIYRFHPAVDSSHILNGKPSGPGAERECVFYDGVRVTEVVSGQRDGEWQEIKVTKGSLPLLDTTASWQLSETPDGKTKVVTSVDYVPKYGVFGKVMNALVIRPKFTKILGHALESLELHAKTGALIGKGGAVLGHMSMSEVA